MSNQTTSATLCYELYENGQYDEAQQVFERSLGSQGQPDPNMLVIGNNIGFILFSRKEYTNAKDILILALEHMERQGHDLMLTCKINLAWTYAMLNDLSQAETLAKEVLGSLKGPQISEIGNVQQAKKILKCVMKMREIVITKFSLFSQLPHEIQDLVWEVAAVRMISSPKKVTILTQGDEISSVKVKGQPPLTACRRSYEIYSRWYTRHNRDVLVVDDRKHPRAVNFANDIFHITGQFTNLGNHLKAAFLPFQRIALHEQFSHVEQFLEEFPHLRELWLLFRCHEKLLSADESQQAWLAHHCEEFPDLYMRFLDVNGARNRIICPVCDWRDRLGQTYETAIAPINTLSHDFVLTYSSSVPVFPCISDMNNSDYPMLRWVRRGRCTLMDPSKQFIKCDKREHFRLIALEYYQRHEQLVMPGMIDGLVNKSYRRTGK